MFNFLFFKSYTTNIKNDRHDYAISEKKCAKFWNS
jgi:hypothetical protein